MQGNPGKFFLWIPESWSLESGIEFPQLKTTEYSTWNPQCAIQNPILSWIPLHALGREKGGDLPQDKGQHRNTDLHSVFEAFSFYGCHVLKRPELV